MEANKPPDQEPMLSSNQADEAQETAVPSGLPEVYPDLTFRQRTVFLAGCGIGLLSFTAAMLMIPESATTPSDHDLMLGKNLAFIFPLLVGYWAGFVRRSLWWIMVGVSVGPVIGNIYNRLTGNSFDFFTVVIGLPCLLSGVTAVLLGHGGSSGWKGLPLRFGKGLLAGLVLAIVYDVILSVLCYMLIEYFAQPSDLINRPVARFHLMMWIAGVPALGIAGGIYLPLFHWSANLNRKQKGEGENVPGSHSTFDRA